jgi:hypothetical protein
MKTLTILLALFSLIGCAGIYTPMKMCDMKSSEEFSVDDSVSIGLISEPLIQSGNSRYQRSSLTKGYELIGLRINNQSHQDFTFNINNAIVTDSVNNPFQIISLRNVADKIDQAAWAYFLLAGVIGFYADENVFIPIPIGAVYAIINHCKASAANKRFKLDVFRRELDYNKIPALSQQDGLIAIKKYSIQCKKFECDTLYLLPRAEKVKIQYRKIK